MTPLWQNIALAAGAAFVLFGVTWLLSRRVNNYGLVDVTWSYALVSLLAIYATGTAGDPARKLVIGVMGAIWALRLGTHILLRIRAHHPGEDVRYAVLRAKWRDRQGLKFFLFFQSQAALIVLLSLPHLLAMSNPEPGLGWVEWAGLGVWLAGIVGESAADWQLKRFKAGPGNRGRVCDAGLWRCSRHPNYFFESVIWWGFWLFACGSPWGWMTIYAPLLILWFLLRVTGIPLTEKCAVESKGEAYRRYQRTTSAFVPWFPKRIP
jgi:steroid 5-alpha reductase family enzyme